MIPYVLLKKDVHRCRFWRHNLAASSGEADLPIQGS
jgi:hypothetical protein